MSRIAFIGLGNMGGPMAANLVKAGHALRVFDLIYVLTANSKDTMSMSVFARQQLVEFQEVGLGSAASTLIFLIIALLVAATLVAGRVRLGEEPR